MSMNEDVEIGIFFRIVGCTDEELFAMRARLVGAVIDMRRRKDKNDWVMTVELVDEDTCTRVRDAWRATNGTAAHGIYVSILTSNDMGGISLPEYVCDLWHATMGSMDFSFVVS